ncbi:MAG TPA: lipid-A-disaccharide synthase [Steroidobacteraceae bacterium]
MPAREVPVAPSRALRIALVAGEASGDQIGAALIGAVRRALPDAQFFGVGGPRMQAAGFVPWAASDELAVMGLTEVVRHLPRLLRLRRQLRRRLLEMRPDAFVGIDAPEFNLGLAAQLKAQGIRTVQYVSPQVWAWRRGRVRSIGRSCDLVLCLLPFETQFYRDHGVRAQFVGHPLADQIPLEVDRDAARRALDVQGAGPLVALLPGSRLGEVTRLGRDFAGAAHWLHARHPEVRFIAPMASAAVRAVFAAACDAAAPGTTIRLLDGHAQAALAAADVALVASGTATLEALLSKRPMVVAYRLGNFTAFLLRRLGIVKVQYFSQPNLLAGHALVPEFFQQAVTPAALGAALEAQLRDPAHAAQLAHEFRRIHEQLRRGGAQLAAAAIIALARPPAAAAAYGA